jgi:hypothetical protein
MASAYPAALDSFTAHTDNVDDVMAADVNELQEAIVATQTELGTDVAGSATNLVTRLAVSLSAGGYIEVEAPSTLTISSGAVTVTKNNHILDTEGSAASDDLTTISGFSEGWLLFLRIANSARDVVIKHGSGNIVCAGGLDITLGTTSDWAMLLYDDTLDKWLAGGLSSTLQSDSVSLSDNNTWTGTQTYSAAVQFNATTGYKYTAVSAGTTLDATHQDVNVDATAGAVTITLPTAVGCAGRRYWVRKLDSSANAVIVDGDGAETINGATTYSLTSQYSTVEVESNGAN